MAIKKSAPKKTKPKPKDKPGDYAPPVRAHDFNVTVSRPPAKPKILMERKNQAMPNEHEQQSHSQQQSGSQQKQGGSSSGGGGGKGGGGGDPKAALEAILQYIDDTNFIPLDPHLEDLFRSARKSMEGGGK